MRKIENTKLLIFIVTRITVIIAGIVAVFEQNWTYLAFSLFTLAVMMLPSFIEKSLNLDIPSEFEIVLILFIYSAMFLGEIRQFYDRFWWWDNMLHGFSGLVLGNIGFLIVSYLNRSSRTTLHLSPVFVSFFSFCFAVAMGAVWEIYEYFMDQVFGFNMQRGSLDDTMTDLILDTIGAAVFAVLGYFQQKGKINIIGKYLIKHDQDKLSTKN
ncbi:MAG: hypothetical protein GX262_07600 [Clostridia bacterium]|jgi:uncharacterized membrane protein YjdF|nr:hypothetical protein [Clostridia bacterium]